MTLRVLTVNVGSSSSKLDLFSGLNHVAEITESEVPTAVDVVAYRIVHGGERFAQPTVITDRVRQQLEELCELAPLHQPPALAAIDRFRTRFPMARHVACFDTAFHQTLSAGASTYPVPQSWRDRGVRKYGFHGLSHSYVAARARELLPNARRVISCHLGSGASVTAIRDGRSVDTSMGFTPLEGLVMATRPGSLDPGVLPFIERHLGIDSTQAMDDLEHRSGLLAIAGTADMQAIEVDANDRARLALDIYLHRLTGTIAAMSCAAGGIDALVFTGGVGEHSALVRSRSAERLEWLGVFVDSTRNDAGQPDRIVSPDGAPVVVLVLHAREDLVLARQASELC